MSARSETAAWRDLAALGCALVGLVGPFFVLIAALLGVSFAGVESMLAVMFAGAFGFAFMLGGN